MPPASDLREQLQATLGDAYVIARELGGGGMSRVFVAREAALKRDVVIKVLSPDLASGVSFDRFQREVELAARLQHPNIVPLLAAGASNDLPYYTMPLVDGESLRARLARAGELPIRDALAILRDVARALAYAHAHGVVHRDIKPDNVLLSGDYAVVTDFGVAKAISDARRPERADSTLTALGTALGTPAYMAPEQSAGDPATDHRADLYAFGVMAYEMLAGAPPFAARSAQAMMAAHATETPVSLSVKRQAIPAALSSVVMRCLEKRPADRPQTADEILRDLDAAAMATLAGTNTSVAAPQARSRSSVALRYVALAAAIVVVAVVAIVVRRRGSGGAVALNPSLIAVVPFRVTSSDPMLRSLREGMLDLVAAKLTGSLRTVDARTALAVWRRAGGTETADVEDQRAVDAMRATGAGRMLEGDILQTAAGVTVNGTLIDLRRPKDRVAASVAGAPAAVAALVDTLIAKLIARGAGESEQTASMLAAIPFPALQAYVAGQAAYRRGLYQEATDQFARAVGLDSAFALAGLRLSEAAAWSVDRRGRIGLEVARKHADKLGTIDRLALDEGTDDGSCAAALARQEAAVRVAPDVPELWYRLADNLTHCGGAMGLDRGAWQRSLAGFNRALALDSSFYPALEHVPMLYAFLGDTVNAERTLAMFSDTSDFLAFNRFFVTADRKELDRSDAALETQPVVFTALVAVATGSWIETPSIPDAERLLSSASRRAVTDADRQTVAQAIESVALTRGQPQRAAEAARSAGEGPGVALLNATFWDGDSATAARSLPAARRLISTPPADTAADEWITTAFAVAEYDLAASRVPDSPAPIGAMLRAFKTTSARETSRARRFALLLDAQSAVLGKRPDAGQLVTAADSMLKRVNHGAYNESAGNLIVARLWERLGDARRAYDASKRIVFNTNPWPFMSTYIRERGRLAAVAGDTVDAVRQYRRYVAARADPEPALIPDRDAARRELARLEKLTAGK